MCILILSSYVNGDKPNPNLSFIIKKNPDKNINCSKLAKGTSYGYYHIADPGKYITYFEEGNGEISFKEHSDQQFEYITTEQYNSSHCALKLLTEYLQCAGKNISEYDIGSDNEIMINMIKIESRAKSIIQKIADYYPHVNIILNDLVYNSYKLIIKNKTTIYELINFTTFLLIIISILNTNDLFVETHILERAIESMNKLNFPYFIRYIMASRVIQRKFFDKLKEQLQLSNKHKYKLYYGTTAEHRLQYISSKLNFNKNIIDFGCGEGTYVVNFAQRIKDNKYYAFDIDTNELKKAKDKIDASKINNVIFVSDNNELDNIASTELSEIIITEVVEHIEPDKSIDIITNIINNYNFSKIIITTPNYEFNKFYIMENKYRHDDHKVEYTKDEFKEYMEKIFNKVTIKYKYEYVDIGDTVDDIPCTQGIIINKIND